MGEKNKNETKRGQVWPILLKKRTIRAHSAKRSNLFRESKLIIIKEN